MCTTCTEEPMEAKEQVGSGVSGSSKPSNVCTGTELGSSAGAGITLTPEPPFQPPNKTCFKQYE